VIAIGDQKADIEVTRLAEGQTATFEVEGGFARKPAPCDGLYIETRTSVIFIPLHVVERVLARADVQVGHRRGGRPR